MKFSKPIILMVLCAVLSLLCGAGFRFYQAFHADSEDILKSLLNDDSEYDSQVLKKQGKFNVLIMGEDDVEGSRRSDTILFAAVDVIDKNIRVLSLPRDTRVQIPGHGIQKLNHAFAFGGPELLKATISQYLGQPILYYVLVDYDSFPALVDILGGIEIDVQRKMRYVDRAGKLDINIQPGLQVLDGKTALHFVRFRKDALGDIGRVQRQQQFIKAMLKKIYDPAVIVKIPELTAQLMKLFKTDMPLTLAVQLAGFTQNELGRDRIFFSTLQGQPETINKLSYWVGNVDSANLFLGTSIDMLLSGDIKLKQSAAYGDTHLLYSSALDELPSNGRRNGGTRSASNDVSSKDAGGNVIQKETETPRPTREEIVSTIKAFPESVAVLNGTGIAGVGNEIANRLQKLGIDVIYTGNAKHFDYKFGNIVYPLKAGEKTITTAKMLGDFLNIPKNLVRPNNQAFYASVIIGHDYRDTIKKLDELIKISNGQN